ncbi:CRM-domain containing factor CFM2, chloroplastic isoform X1 [Camellia sinensis]|uniref:CRM-domain containing factor CFM2, chloroplastic isoform X1 n=1 Tax=Camellia sinensis TaxID=4442 RepID=UPI0010359696|nr:CRM-domain containing factor CFM2, chloroplastic isoform X1 [Camellia sinensis]
MLLPLSNHHQTSLPFNSLPNPFFTPFPFPKTLLFRNPRIPPNSSLLRPYASASSAATRTLPQSAIKRIADKLRSLGYVEEEQDSKQTLNSHSSNDLPGEIFIPLPNRLPKYRVGHTIDTSWSSPENPVPEPGLGTAIQRFHGFRRKVIMEKVKEREMKKGEARDAPTVAELTMNKGELRRLRTIGIGLKKKLKVGKAGITEGIVNGIHERWRNSELVKIVCEDICRLNMKRTHGLLEKKTGGLVIWRSGSNIILYRGANYKYPYFLSDNNSTNDTSAGTSRSSSMDSGVHVREESCSSGTDYLNSAGRHSSNKMAQPPLIQGVGSPNRVRFQLPGEAQLVEEADSLLDGLGPRFTDWWGYDPLPVDADLLAAIVPGYRKPFRLLPYGVKPKLTNDEMTILKRLGRPLPCHFVLGRNRKLQGLAASIVKLWEKCEIAKIAVKRGVQNTNSELMAGELKWLTGGTLLSRDKEIIVLYRGKDFLPAAVSSAIEERRKCGIPMEKHRTDFSSSVMTIQECQDECDGISDQKRKLVSEQRKLRSTEAAVKKTSTKLQMAFEKKAKAEKLLAELDKEETPQEAEIDKEGITEEERYMLRKVGLKMKPFLLLGRRGVFDGTVENMHLHWKYRELVKVICGGRSIEAVHGIARALEAESNGILVAVERVSKGYAIIVYRGKNYQRPDCLRPQTLLNKREAMKRSIEAQRRESLKLHVLKLGRNIDELKLQLSKGKETNNMQSDKESNFQLVKEQEAEKKRLAEYTRSDTDLFTNDCSTSVTPNCTEVNVEARDRCGANSSSFDPNDDIDALSSSPETSQRDILIFSKEDKDEFKITESEPLADAVCKESNVIMGINGQGGDVESATCPDDSMSQDQTSSLPVVNVEPHVRDKAVIPFVESPKSGPEPSVHSTIENVSSRVPFRAVRLSNRERLFLRKQALRMKKRPVLAVGRSNIVTGVAKTIKTHFQKYPLAIVNVKGRAKGTSVQEVVFKLEQATDGVLVSQEPSKIILYRGWGAGEKPGQTVVKNTKDVWKTSAGREGEIRPVISPELVSAIRLECELQRNQEVEEA